MCVCVQGSAHVSAVEIKQSNPKGMEHLLSFILLPPLSFFTTLKDNVMLVRSSQTDGGGGNVEKMKG